MKNILVKRGLGAGFVLLMVVAVVVLGGAWARATEVGNCGEVEITEIFTNFRDDQSEQFVEFHNPTAGPVSLVGCVARTRFSNRVLEVRFGNVVILPGEYQAYSLESLGLQLAKSPTIDRVFELVGGDAVWEAYGVSEAHITTGGEGEGWSSAAVVDRVDLPNSRIGRSWALVNGEWVTATPTPSADNRTAPEFQTSSNTTGGTDPNSETGTASTVPELGSVIPEVLPPVEHGLDGDSSGGESGLADCGPGRYRNPETNRCRNIPTEPEVKPCAEGYERNPETNRCRRIREQTSVDFGIPDAGSTGGSSASAVGTAVANIGETIIDAMDVIFRDEYGYLQGWRVALAVVLAVLVVGAGICWVSREKLAKTPIGEKVLELYAKKIKKY
ncbi:hypothetical protein FWC63_00315 [Candidatus Saccharibacteria bacterium]|nr:hypothetical protein [Candidatus Saccharibacteria bacterium]